MEQNKIIKLPDLSPSLSKQESEIVLISREAQIKAHKDIEISKKVSEVISLAIVALNGFKMDTKERSLIEEQVVFLLKNSFPFLTLGEFQKAVYLGSLGNFKNKPNDIVFLSVSNINQWLMKYKMEVKRDVMKKQIDFEAKQNEVNIEEEKKKSEILNKSTLISEFNNFLEGKPVYDPVNLLYDFMDKREMVHIENDRKIEIFEECKEKYTEHHKKSGSIADHMMNRKILQEIEMGSERITAIIKMLAKQKALLEVFQDIKDSGMQMEDYLELNGF